MDARPVPFPVGSVVWLIDHAAALPCPQRCSVEDVFPDGSLLLWPAGAAVEQDEGYAGRGWKRRAGRVWRTRDEALKAIAGGVR